MANINNNNNNQDNILSKINKQILNNINNY